MTRNYGASRFVNVTYDYGFGLKSLRQKVLPRAQMFSRNRINQVVWQEKCEELRALKSKGNEVIENKYICTEYNSFTYIFILYIQ